DERMREDAGAALVREMLPDHRLVDDDAVGDVEKGSAGEERGMKRREAVAVGVHKGEEPRLDKLGMLLGRPSQRLEDHALGQRRRQDELVAVQVLEPGILRGVEASDVGAPPLLVRFARRGELLEGGEGRFAALAQPGRFALELVQGFGGEGHGYPTEPSISSWMSRFSFTAYSSGSSLVNGSMKPLTIIVSASARGMPRLIR